MVIVSVVLTTFKDDAKLIEPCLKSIRKNKSKYSYEIIVVDAGNPEKVKKIIKKYVDRYFYLPKSLRGTGRNYGIKKARGKYVCFTDTDCLVPKDWITSLVDSLKTENKKDAKIISVGGKNVPWISKNETREELAIRKAIRSTLVAWKARNVIISEKKQLVNHNPPMNSIYFRGPLLEVGGFGEERNEAEDVELDAQLIEKGYKLIYDPRIVVEHKHASTVKEFYKQVYLFGKSRIYIGRKFPQYLEPYHYGPIVLLFSFFSPLLFIPIIMALLNGLIISHEEDDFSLFKLVFVLTLTFYYYYAKGELQEIFHLK